MHELKHDRNNKIENFHENGQMEFMWFQSRGKDIICSKENNERENHLKIEMDLEQKKLKPNESFAFD